MKLRSGLIIFLYLALLVVMASSWQTSQVKAQVVPLVPVSPAATAASEAADATLSAQATPSADATTAALLQIEQRRDRDITETGGKQKGELAALLDANPVTPLSWHNPFQHAVRNAVDKGVPANTLVLLLLFPVITAVIAGSRHIIGLRGFGVYTPAVLSVAFVSSGIISGVILFIVVLASALLSKKVIQKLKLQYLPRTAMLMWAVSLSILLFLLLMGQLGLTALYTMSIFTILIIMLLSENFMESQLASSQSEAVRLTFETVLLAIICSFIIGSRTMQAWVIIHPEFTIVAVAVANLLVGRYSGLRLMEYVRFRSILDK
jgi:hypothetical protein